MRTWARAVAQGHLAGTVPRRWQRVQAVAARARQIKDAFGHDGDVLVAAAYLHDIGYAPELADSGFPPLDGARYLREIGAPRRLVNLVAHHSLARVEAHRRGLDQELAEFEDEHTPVRDALWFCDMTTGPDGQYTTVRARIAEIQVEPARERLLVVHRTLRHLQSHGIHEIFGESMPSATEERDTTARRL